MSLAPIGVSTYSRLQHLKQTIEALKANTLARESDLYIFSDAPKQGDEEKVAQVRNYIHTINGFKKVHIIERKKNSRVKNNRGGIKQLLDQYGRIIFMEEDIVTAPGFLQFMNESLNIYEKDKRIFSITGYSPPIDIPFDYFGDVFILRRTSGWGMGVWHDRYKEISYLDNDEVLDRFSINKEVEELSKYGEDLLNMILLDAAGKIDAFDVKIFYYQFLNEKYTIYPRKSLVRNIGHDGSGIHCGKTNKFDVDLWDKYEFKINGNVKLDDRIIKSNYRFRNFGKVRKVMRNLKSLKGKNKSEMDKLGEGLIFIISQPRAGSTLLQRILSGHPEIHTTAEPWIMLHPLYALKRNGMAAEYEYSLARQGLDDFLKQIPEGEELYIKALRGMASVLYNRALELSGKRFFLDKTPRYYFIIPELYRVFPKAKFIFLLRNPMAVFSSVLSTWFGNQIQALIKNPNYIDLTKGPHYLVEGIKKLKEDAIVVHYEELVRKPKEVIQHICNRIGIPFYENILEYGQYPAPKGRFGDSVGVHKHNRPVSDYIDKWVKNLAAPNLIEFASQYLSSLGSDVFSNLGYSYQKIKDKIESERVQDDQKTAQKKIEESSVLNEQGEDLFSKGDLEGALNAFTKAIAIAPNYAIAHNNLGVLYWQTGEVQKAVDHFTKALEIDPNDRDTVLNCGELLRSLKKVDDARNLYSSYLQKNPNDKEISRAFIGADSQTLNYKSNNMISETNFSFFTYSKNSHFLYFNNNELALYNRKINKDNCTLKVYQDLLIYTFILENIPKGSKILEVGGGNSRVLKSIRNDYECWNIDKLEGLGNGPTSVDLDACRLIRAYMGEFSKDVPDNYFDFVFSISALEHVDDNEKTFHNVCLDIDRVLKPGGLSLHAFDVVVKKTCVWTNKLLPYMFNTFDTVNTFIPLWNMALDSDLYYMSKRAYSRSWEAITKRPYEEFGKPVSYNILWKKPLNVHNGKRVSDRPKSLGKNEDAKNIYSSYLRENPDDEEIRKVLVNLEDKGSVDVADVVPCDISIAGQKQDQEEIEKQRRLRKQVARSWLDMSGSDLAQAYRGEAGKLHRQLLSCGIKDFPLTDEERKFVVKLTKHLHKKLKVSRAMKYVLAAMLYLYPHEMPVKFYLQNLPAWFREEYWRFLLQPPSFFRKVGEINEYCRYLGKVVNYLHGRIYKKTHLDGWAKIALIFAEKANFIPVYFSSEELKDIYVKRAEIVEFVLRSEGYKLDFSFPPRPSHRKKIRLGIHFRRMAAYTETFATLPLFEFLDREEFEVFLYVHHSDGNPADQYARGLADKFTLLPNNMKECAEIIRRDDLDILFFGNNSTAVMNGSLILASHRLARRQCVHFCSPGTTGLRYVDYFVIGDLIDPAGDAEKKYSEQLLKVEGSGICFNLSVKPEAAPQTFTRKSVGISDKSIAFVSGANFFKIIPELRHTWAQIVADVPDSVLVLYPFGSAWTNRYPKESFIKEMENIFDQYGIARERLIVLNPLPDQEHIKALLRLTDVYLDALPYSGATSLIDPLEAGLPPVVMEGSDLRFRQGAAILKGIGMHDLIAESEEAYIRLAISLATNPDMRKDMRNKILTKMERSPRFLDPRLYAVELGSVLKEISSPNERRNYAFITK